MLNKHMKIYELLNQNPRQAVDPNQEQQQLNQQTPNPEDDQQGKFDADKVDQNLQDLAQGAGDQQAQPDLPNGAQQENPELDNQNIQPVDDALIQQTKNEPYTTKWNVPDKSPIAPMKILSMQLSDLSTLRNMIRFQQQNLSMRNKIGLKDSKSMEWYNDMLKFVDTVMTFKTTNTKSQMAQLHSTPAYQQSSRSK
jgi:hypothetical protein